MSHRPGRGLGMPARGGVDFSADGGGGGHGCGNVATFRTSIGRGAEVVAASRAAAGAITATLRARSEDGAKVERGEDGEEESGEPVREVDEAHALFHRLGPRVIAEAEER